MVTRVLIINKVIIYLKLTKGHRLFQTVNPHIQLVFDEHILIIIHRRVIPFTLIFQRNIKNFF